MTTVDQPDAPPASDQAAPERTNSTHRNVLMFGAATGVGRLAALAREVIAARLFGIGSTMSAFTIAFQIPNLLRSLFADSALQGAFIPVFTDLLHEDRRKEAFRMASILSLTIICVLGSMCALLALFAPTLVHVFAPGFTSVPGLDHLTSSLTRIMTPVVVLISLTGVVAGILNSFDRFGLAAAAPVVFNLTIIAGMLGLRPFVANGIYAYALGVLLASILQLLVVLPGLRGTGARLQLNLPLVNAEATKVLKIMFPTAVALGLINFDALLNSLLGTLVSPETPAAIEKAFRIYQLPQGLFSVAIATVLFPQLARSAAAKTDAKTRQILGTGMRYCLLLMIPSAAFLIALAHPMIEIIYQRGAFGSNATHLTSKALLFWGLTLPFTGVSSLLWRVFLTMRRPWLIASIAVGSLAVNGLVSLALYKPLGISGIVIGTAVATIGLVAVELPIVSRLLGGVEGRETGIAALKMTVAAAALAFVSYFVWKATSGVFGHGLIGDGVSLLLGVIAGVVVYSLALVVLDLTEIKVIFSRVLYAIRQPLKNPEQ